MTWTYRVSDGELTHDGSFIGTGYSGAAGVYRNNSGYETAKNLGPIPRGTYIIGKPVDDEKLGPCVMPLKDSGGDNRFSRDGFYIHGDNARHTASHGCIILGPLIRHAVAASGDDALEVI